MAFRTTIRRWPCRRVGAHGERGRARAAGRRAVAEAAVSNRARLRGIVAGRVERRLLPGRTRAGDLRTSGMLRTFVRPPRRSFGRSVRSVHGQNYAKARLASHHLRVGIRRLVEWDGLDHGGHAAQRTETERSVSGRRVPRQGTFELAAPEYEI